MCGGAGAELQPGHLRGVPRHHHQPRRQQRPARGQGVQGAGVSTRTRPGGTLYTFLYTNDLTYETLINKTPTRLVSTTCHFRQYEFYETSSDTWNNGKEVPRWGVAEIQKMSPSHALSELTNVLYLLALVILTLVLIG